MSKLTLDQEIELLYWMLDNFEENSELTLDRAARVHINVAIANLRDDIIREGDQ